MEKTGVLQIPGKNSENNKQRNKQNLTADSISCVKVHQFS